MLRMPNPVCMCDNLYIIFKLCLKCFQHEKYFSLTKTNLRTKRTSFKSNSQFCRYKSCFAEIWVALRNEVDENMILPSWEMPLRGFVRGHKNMSHICKWRKIVLIIKVLRHKSVGRRENTPKLCDDGWDRNLHYTS